MTKSVSSWPAHFKNGQIFRNRPIWQPWHRRLSAVTAKKEILIVVASLVRCCAIKKNVIVATICCITIIRYCRWTVHGSSEEKHLPDFRESDVIDDVIVRWWRHMPIFVTIASRQKQIMTSQNRLTRPFCKPPANLQHTLHAVVHLHSNVLSSAAQPLKMQRSTERE